MVYDKDRSGLMEMEELHHFIKASLYAPSGRKRTFYKLRQVFANERAVYDFDRRHDRLIFANHATE